MSSISCKGAIFDLDGVITQTARVHFQAWKNAFNEYLKRKADRGEKDFKPFTYEADYLPYVDGKPRYQGVKSFLESRDIELFFGEPSDPPGKETICGIGNRKNEFFCRLIAEEGVDIYQSTVSLIRELKARGIRVGVASSSKNCKYILEKANLLSLFEIIVNGIVSKEIGLQGKPQPDIFVAAADNLGVSPSECIMIEDAVSGVEAGKRGNFALVIGVARSGDKENLKAHGADIAVEDLSELTFMDIEKWFQKGLEKDSWNLTYYGFEPTEERLREALTTTGNGYFGTRGCLETERVFEDIHYPGTYIAGVYNKLPSIIHHKKIYNNDLVNCPNWLLIEVSIAGGPSFHLNEVEILSYKHTLDMKDGVMSRSFTFKDKQGRITAMEIDRIAGMDNPHYGAIRFTITPLNYSEKITFQSSLDGSVINYGVARYRELSAKHLSAVAATSENGALHLHVRTVTSKVDIFLSSKCALFVDGTPRPVEKTVFRDKESISEGFSIDARKGVSYTLEKFVVIHTSKDMGTRDPMEASKTGLLKLDSFNRVVKEHIDAWHTLWDKADITIEGDRLSQKAVRLHIYHLLTTASPHNKGVDNGMPARGLHGEAYRGHIFWDELFILPFYNLHFPEISRALLVFRCRRLDAAREYAAENGYQGAMFPWQTADDGKEETQSIHYNPLSGKWDADLSRLQRHVSIAIAYNIWEYYYCTNDLEFLYRYGVETLLEIARFWASAAVYDEKDGRYHISHIMGPDEYHEKYPDAEEPGLTDNAYTNIMVGWLLHKTIETVQHLPNVVIKNQAKKIGFAMSELDKWRQIVNKLNVVISKEEIISQFERYMNLAELDWNHYREKYKDIRRMDRILKAEGDSPDRYQVSKQADTLMIYYLLSPSQVKHIFEIMGYTIGDSLKSMKKNYEYYVKRTSHGSTLSYIVHAAILKYLDTHKKDMWEWFLEALKSDLYDTQRGTTAEGIHCGVMAGSLDIIIKSFAGVNLFKDHIRLSPNMPAHWRKLSFKILFKDNYILFELTREGIKVSRLHGQKRKILIQIEEKEIVLEGSELEYFILL